MQAAPCPVSEETIHPACGWYESSFELQAGLTVTEDADPLLFELWSQAHLGAASVQH